MKQRIYGFLLRRILGPYLSTSSLEKLHNSIDIAISEGKFIIKDVDLDCTYLNTKLLLKVENVCIQKATVKKLAIFISLRDSHTKGYDESWQNSISKMYKLGYGTTEGNTTTTGGVSLHVHIEFEGIEVELAPFNPTEKTSLQDRISEQTNVSDDNGDSNSSTSFVGSYIEAALNSLRLSFNIKELSIRLNSTFLLQSNSKRQYIQLKLATVSYKDIFKASGTTKNLKSVNNITYLPEIILHKQIIFSSVSVVLGTMSPDTSSCKSDEWITTERSLGKFLGTAIMKIQIASYPTENMNSLKREKMSHLKREIDVAFKDSIEVDIDHYNILILKGILDSFTIPHDEYGTGDSSLHHHEESKEVASHHDEYRASLIATEDDIINSVENELGLLRNIVGNYDGRRGVDDTSIEPGDYQDSTDQSYEAFFDANDLGFSHYQSVLASCQTFEEGDDNIIHTKFSLFLLELSVKVFTRRQLPDIMASSEEFHPCNLEISSSPDDMNVYTGLILRDFDLTSSISKDKLNVTSSISYLDVREYSGVPSENLSRKDDTAAKSISLLHFEEGFVDENTSVLGSGRPLFMHIISEKSGYSNPKNSLSVNISLQPMNIVYHKSCIDDLITFSEKIKGIEYTTGKKVTEQNLTNDNPYSFNLAVTIDSLTMTVPFEKNKIRDNMHDSSSKCLDSLFQRSFTTISKRTPSSHLLEIGWTFDDFCFTIERNATDKSRSSPLISITCERSLIFIRSFERDYRHQSEILGSAKVLDIMAFSGETSIDPNALIRVELTDGNYQSSSNTDCQKQTNFPFVTPLHTVKTTQQYENDDVCDPIIDTIMTDGCEYARVDLKTNVKKKNIRGSDPQYEMSKDAKKSKLNLDVHIPSISLDTTVNELSAILEILESLSQKSYKASALSTVKENDNPTRLNNDYGAEICPSQKLFYSFSLKCDQITASIKSRFDDLKCELNRKNEFHDCYSYMVAFDNMKTHVLFGPLGLKNCRLLSNDITLYEVRNQAAMNADERNEVTPMSGISAFERTKQLRKRQYSLPKSISKPIFYRSKLSQPLSPETPAFLVDILVNKENADDSEERALHFSIYDVTYRFDLDSCWIERISKIINHFSPPKRANANECLSTRSESDESDEAVSVTNLFVTVSDCCIDYTAPTYFKRQCRGILRLSEMRITSNVVIPFGPVQAFKVSIVDISFYLSNNRVPYSAENKRLSCAKFILKQDFLFPHPGKRFCEPCEKSFNDALHKMRFVNVATVDCIDTIIVIARSVEPDRSISNDIESNAQPQPFITATLSAGLVCLSTCHDSFKCFTDMFGELMIKLTMPSENEIQEMKDKSSFICDTNNTIFDPSINLQNSFVPNGVASADISADELDHDKGSGIEKSENLKSMNCHTVDSSKSIPQNNSTTNPSYEYIPDSELSASQLRMKYHKKAPTLNEASDMEKASLTDALEHGKVFETEKSENVKSMNYNPVKSTQSTSQYKSTSNPSLKDIPDSELSASQLRMKHQRKVPKLDEASEIEKSLLIKNFYTFQRTHQEQNNDNLTSLTSTQPIVHDESSHLLGSGWTTVDHEWSRNPEIPIGQEQVARWYEDDSTNIDRTNEIYRQNLNNNTTNYRIFKGLQIFPQHVPINPVSDPLSGGDMNAAKFAGTKNPPTVRFRLIIKDLSLNCLFYDGFDWPEIHKKSLPGESHDGNLFDDFETPSSTVCLKTKNEDKYKAIRSARARVKLMNSLVEENHSEGDLQRKLKSSSGHQKSASLPRTMKRKHRQNDRFFKLSLSGLKLRLDSFTESRLHALSSCMDLSVSDMFLAETISCGSPVKILGEWFNEIEHPRDSNDGILMMKMVSMRPKTIFSADGKLMSDESKVTLELLPLRCIFHQIAIRFIRSFFSSDVDENHSDTTELEGPAEAFFQQFQVLPCKLKVDYIPLGVDTNALRDGAYVELINLLPLEDMVLTLKRIDMKNITGWGTAFGELSYRWLEDICATQLHKFITNSSPFKPFSHVGVGAANMVIIPLEEAKCNGPVVSGIRRGTASFAGAVAFETLTTTAKLAKFAAKKLGKFSMYQHIGTTDNFPIDHHVTPRNINAAARPAIESLSRGLKEANAKIIIIPYREYQRVGTSGAVKSVLKGLPVAICAPLGGASEALSYTLIGARNQLYPSIYREEEANLRGLSPSPYSNNM